MPENYRPMGWACVITSVKIFCWQQGFQEAIFTLEKFLRVQLWHGLWHFQSPCDECHPWYRTQACLALWSYRETTFLCFEMHVFSFLPVSPYYQKTQFLQQILYTKPYLVGSAFFCSFGLWKRSLVVISVLKATLACCCPRTRPI